MKRRREAVQRLADLIGLTRRGVLGLLGFGVVAPPFLTRAIAQTADRRDLPVIKLAGAKPGRITLELPEIAEDGNTVPIGVRVESAMTEQDYVKRLQIVAPRNPRPVLATFEMTPMTGEAAVRLRVRLAQTQSVLAVAEMQDGSHWFAEREIKVTIGGCGGG